MNYNIEEFETIRPYNDDEVKQAVDELLADRQFNVVMKSFVPWLPRAVRNGAIRAAFIGVNSINQFQGRFMHPIVKLMIRRCTSGVRFVHPGIEPGDMRYTFISNHRDIVLDSAILATSLYDQHFPTTCEIAIGDNLIIYPWIRTLVRLNKAFLVRRSLSARELLASSRLMSNYMHYAIEQKHENIWIAQREGRAKDSSDQTQDSVLKMMALGGEGSAVERLKALNIVPLTISYEYDPCDYLKAQELQNKRDNPKWKKSKQDDLDSMKTGIMGKKGRVYYQTAPCINTWLDEYASLPSNQLFKAIARRMDFEIHKNYKLFPGNYIALDLLNGVPANARFYSREEQADFEKYLKKRLKMIKVENKDEDFLRQQLLTMYANPVRNYNAAHGKA